MPIEITRLFAYEGPNIYGPQPGVMMRTRCDRDRSARLRVALKDGAQALGLVLAGLELAARPIAEGMFVEATFATEAPALGAALCEYVVAGMAAEASGDAEWDRDTPLFELQVRRRREALPVSAVQLLAEARQRDVPAFVSRDGQLQIGQGVRGWSLDLAVLRERGASAPPVPWQRLGAVPIVAVSGATGRRAALEQLAAELSANGVVPAVLDDADLDATRALLASPSLEAALIGLDSEALLRRGLGFAQCQFAVITDRDGQRPLSANDDEEWLRALGVPMLVSTQPARINLADPKLLPLVPYAPFGVLAW